MSLLQTILSEINTSQVNKVISQKTGVSESQTQSILEQALPALLGGIANQAKNAKGATSLLSALDKDHDGSILDDLAELANHPQSQKGKEILNHVLGEKLEGFETLLGEKSKANATNVDQVLKMAAPLLLGALGKVKANEGFDAKILANKLLSAKNEIGEKADAKNLLSFLDQDKDGNIKNDLLRMGIEKFKSRFLK